MASRVPWASGAWKVFLAKWDARVHLDHLAWECPARKAERALLDHRVTEAYQVIKAREVSPAVQLFQDHLEIKAYLENEVIQAFPEKWDLRVPKEILDLMEIMEILVVKEETEQMAIPARKESLDQREISESRGKMAILVIKASLVIRATKV